MNKPSIGYLNAVVRQVKDAPYRGSQMRPEIAVAHEPDELRRDARIATVLCPIVPVAYVALHAVRRFGQRAFLRDWRRRESGILR